MITQASLRVAFPLMLAGSIDVWSADTKPTPAAGATNTPPAKVEPAATTAADVLKQRAERGDVNAQFALGMEYVRAFEYREAIKWHVRAAEKGHARAQHMMGVRYVFGQGVARDREEAALWFAKAAAQGEPYSQFSLGLRCVLGDSVPQDFEMAARWFKLAAEQGHSEAQRSLGRRYAAGEGVKKDLAEALKWYLVAAANGDAESKTLAEKLTPTMTAVQIADGMTGAAGFVPKPRF